MSPLTEGPGRLAPALSAVLGTAARFRPSLRSFAIALIVIGGLTCLVPVALVGYSMWQENQLTQKWAAQTAAVPGVVDTPGIVPTGIQPPFATPAPATPTPRVISAIFALRVPKIGYFAAVQEGVSTSILASGPGHYPTTAMPGKPGLVGIAAHNTFWIPFGQLGPGDSIVLETRYGKFTYKVTGTRIVSPNDATVLAPTGEQRLVLTTCWPLWAGNLAPQRLAIFAQQL